MNIFHEGEQYTASQLFPDGSRVYELSDAAAVQVVATVTPVDVPLQVTREVDQISLSPSVKRLGMGLSLP